MSIKKLVLILILIIAAILRLVGTNPGYNPYHSDEGMSYSSAIAMIRNINLDPTRYDYPSLIPIIHALLYIFIFIPFFIIKNLVFSPEELLTKGDGAVKFWQFIVFKYQQTDVLFWGRYVTAFFSIGVVLATYKLAESYFKDKRISLVAAFLSAVNFRQVLNSHIALPDIYNAFFILLALLAFGKLIRNLSAFHYLLSGLAIGLSISTKYQWFIVFPFLFIHIYYCHKKGINFFRIIFSKNLILSVLVASFLILFFNPYHLIHWEEFRDINSYNLLKYTVGVKEVSYYAFSYLFNIGIGRLITIAAILGIFLGLKKHRVPAIIILLQLIPFFYFFAYYTKGGFYTRNFISVTPLILIFAALFLVSLLDFLRTKFFVKNQFSWDVVLMILVISVSFDQIKNSVVNSYYYAKPWNFVDARNWAAINFPSGATVVSHPWDSYPRNKDLKIVPYGIGQLYSISEMAEDKIDFGFINLDWLTISSLWWMNRALPDALYYWNKPNSLLINSYIGATARELAGFSVATFVKPWQAPDINILVVKPPSYPKLSYGQKLAEFNFDQGIADWKIIDDSTNKIYIDGEMGRISKGSLKIGSGTRKKPLIFVVSPVLKVDSNKALIIEAWIRSQEDISKKDRDGVIRVDFFSDDKRYDLKEKSLDSFFSSRFWGEGGTWINKKLISPVPEGAKYARIILQTEGNFDLWFDDISVYKSKEFFRDPRKSSPYLDYKIDNDILFPYSQAGL